ncbi:uncharacterized protein LOC144866333 [Branchiostoma floridae x Branchiostoma japonicum]
MFEELTSQLRERLSKLRRAENTRKRSRKRQNNRAQFIKNPFKFTRALLGEKKSGSLTSSKEDVEEFLRQSHNDPLRNEPLDPSGKVGKAEEPKKQLNTDEPSWKEVNDVVKKARAGSAPGPSGIPYKVYKKCPLLLRRLWKLFRRIWVKGSMPVCWKEAEGCFVPKEENASTVSQFRTISLLSVECKIFFSVLANRITTYVTDNAYVNTSIQKGGIPGFSGCLEHTGVLSQLIQEAKSSKGDLTVVWLDLANAYGSIPHATIHEALEHYHIPANIKTLITSYFGGLRLRFKTTNFITEWQALEKGIVTGCTISPILFIMAMNLIISSAEAKTRGPVMASGSRQPPLRGFMDDLTVTTRSHVEARWVLCELSRMVTWARMAFKPKKSRSMIIRKGKITNRFNLQVQGETIPQIDGNPIKCLGKWFDATLSDRSNATSTSSQVEEWLKRTERSDLPGKFKLWIYQHGLLPRLGWLLTVYEIPMTHVEGIERKVNKYIRKWLGIPPSFTSIGLYIRSGQLQLPISSVVEEFKVAKCRLVMTYKDSRDQKVREAGVMTRSGRKWSADTHVERAESMLKLRDIIGIPCVGRQGLGASRYQLWEKANPRERRALIQSEVRREEDEKRLAKAVGLGVQGAWCKWELPQRKVTWSELWRLEPYRISFLLRSVYDTLPSPANLHRWGLIEDPACKLCGGRGTMAHILSGCKVALTQGRYRWRHDKVLAVLASILEKERKKNQQPHRKTAASITFVREGEKRPATSRPSSNLLQKAKAWEMRVDLGKKLQFPSVVHTTLRPDIVLFADGNIVMIELTVPWEEGCDLAHERKRSKYQELLLECRAKGCNTWLFPVEIGCRGFPAASSWKLLKDLGLTGRERKEATRLLGEAAEKASCWLWLKRDEQNWRPEGRGEQ